MKVALIVGGAMLAALLLAVGGFFAWGLWSAHTGGRQAYLQLMERIVPVELRLSKGEDPEPGDLERFAKDRVTRGVLYDALEAHEKLHLFPAAYRTQEALAEADLVLWLLHPHELDAPPDEIELMATVPAPGDGSRASRYYLFRFRMNPPHWASSDGWMAGVAGPYDDGPAEIAGSGTFSRFESYESRTPQEHVRVTHETTHR